MEHLSAGWEAGVEVGQCWLQVRREGQGERLRVAKQLDESFRPMKYSPQLFPPPSANPLRLRHQSGRDQESLV